jgi:hypothetical protein
VEKLSNNNKNKINKPFSIKLVEILSNSNNRNEFIELFKQFEFFSI